MTGTIGTTAVRTWTVTAGSGCETAWVEWGDGALRAHGRAFGVGPGPYWVTYELETGEQYVTRRLRVCVEDADGVRELELLRDADSGQWSGNGRVLAGLDGALDCDLGLCPLTNTMPVRRHALHRAPGERTFLMAWVAVPELTVTPSRQTYTHLGPTENGGARVRYASGTFRADVEFDAEGLVVDYPRLAHRHPASGVSGSAGPRSPGR
ncbi:putative glycolipid-binding domain-containing protein [Streptomyces sp. VRA16 Mangrove soil]|uniref:putative glycolipid-binding domain-containing protein n=1 Tax=Streptomyces sp. VRA16 Mangrove soil TaxID=2817434 RepID=UPI001A9F0D9E|nr:putative glycolipid-binding domain-containing protein [Streptomyces sp. VRA16 Mangrove soil]MBO1334118.1 putative glycolipid-binding domain-containing protein [Streptomyces sp. VRA16 Mangrove soil]